MAYQFKPYEKAVGSSVVIAGIILILTAIILLGDLDRGENKKIKYYTFYDKGDGIANSMPIYYNGVEVGKTTSKTLLSSDRVRVEFFIRRKYTDRVRQDSVAFLNEGVLGSSLILTKGSDDAPTLSEGEMLWSSHDPEGKRIIREIHGIIVPPNPIDKLTFIVFQFIDLLADEDGPILSLLVDISDLLAILEDPAASDSATADLVVASKDLLEILSDPESHDTATASALMDVADLLNKVNIIIGDEDTLNQRVETIMLSIDELLKNVNVLTQNLSESRMLGGGGGKNTSQEVRTIDNTEKANDYAR